MKGDVSSPTNSGVENSSSKVAAMKGCSQI
jgi:hypothetical protein